MVSIKIMLYFLNIPCKPVTWNRAYRKLGHGRGMFMTKEGTLYKNQVMMHCREQLEDFKILPNRVLKVRAYFCLPDFITKKGQTSKTAGDLDNYWKLTADAICAAIGVDDSLIWELTLVKSYSESPRVAVELNWIELSDVISRSPFFDSLLEVNE
jgi:Holliday junction resolvase RusA-like endonuclease